MLPLPLGKKASALHKFEMAMKQPILSVASFHFRNLSNDQDKPSPRTSGENTDACLPLISDARGPQKTLTVTIHFNETTD